MDDPTQNWCWIVGNEQTASSPALSLSQFPTLSLSRRASRTSSFGPSLPCSVACSRLCHRLADVASAASGSSWILVRRGRPERKVVGEGGQRTHVHQVVTQQAVAATQRMVDLRQEEVTAGHGEPQSFHHLVDLESIGWRVVVSADAEYVSEHAYNTHYIHVFFFFWSSAIWHSFFSTNSVFCSFVSFSVIFWHLNLGASIRMARPHWRQNVAGGQLTSTPVWTTRLL